MRNVTINLYDDDVTDLNLLASILSTRNYAVRVLNRAVICPISADRADKCPNQNNPCSDIIIADNQMPGMTGTEMLRQQAQRGCPIDIRNKAVASADFDGDGLMMIKGLGYAYFKKPFQLNELFAWLDDCKNRIDFFKPAPVMRKHPRYPANIKVVYTCSSDDNLQNGTILNFSSSGICLKAYASLMEKQSILIKTELPNGCKKASVRWIKKMDVDFYLAGLMAQ